MRINTYKIYGFIVYIMNVVLRVSYAAIEVHLDHSYAFYTASSKRVKQVSFATRSKLTFWLCSCVYLKCM